MLLMVVWHPAAVLREGGMKTGKGIELTADLARFAQVIYKHPEVQPAAVRDQPNLQLTPLGQREGNVTER
jgi:hypothetical protein